MFASYHSRIAYFVLAMVVAFFCCQDSFADSTFVSGTIAGAIWTRDGSPYMVTGDIEVSSLTIEPGVSVLFTGNYCFRINGVLNAVGTVLDSIVFARANSNVGWMGIKMTDLAPGTEFAFCRIDGSIERGLTIVNCPAIIVRRCTISNNSGSEYIPGAGFHGCVKGGGVYVQGAFTFTDCIIRDNHLCIGGWFGTTDVWGGGIYVVGDLILDRCIITNNYIDGDASGGASNACGGGVFIDGTCTIANSVVHHNYPVGDNNYGGGIFVSTGTTEIINSTAAFNEYGGIYNGGGQVEMVNSIVYFNTGTQIAGNMTSSYSCIQGGDTLNSNIAYNPNFKNDTTLIITLGSPCIDRGNPEPSFNDVCFPPSLGSMRNDIGAHGGPEACGWPPPFIECPPTPEDYALCVFSGSVGVGLRVGDEDTITVSCANAPDLSWNYDSLRFTADAIDVYDIMVIAGNDYGLDTCLLSVNVAQKNPQLILDKDYVTFSMSEGDSLPPPQTLHIESNCEPDVHSWNVQVVSGGSWLEIDKASGSNPDSLTLSIKDSSYACGNDFATIRLNDILADTTTVVTVNLIVGAGVYLGGDTTVAQGAEVIIPICLYSSKQLQEVTIPVTHDGDTSLYNLDSVIVDANIVDTAIIVADGKSFIVSRTMHDSPLVEGTYTVGCMYLRVKGNAMPDTLVVDTTTISIDPATYHLRFTNADGDSTIPCFASVSVSIEPLHSISGWVYEGCGPVDTASMSDIIVVLKHDTLGSPPFWVDTTNGDGIYRFDNLPVAVYYIYLPAQGIIVDRDTMIYTLGTLFEDMVGKNVRYCNSFWSDITNMNEGTLPTKFSLSQNHPNPFNPSTTIEFAMPRRADVELSIYNILGQRVRTLVNEELPAGYHTVTWDSKDEYGQTVSSGIYLYRIKAGEYVETKKTVLLK